MTQASALRNPHLDGSSFYWEAGRTGVLLCHGFTATTAEVRLLAEVLHTQGYTVAGPLLPGHGTTPQDCNRFHWQDWYASVEQTYKELASRCEKVVVGGESAGALLALHLASEHLEITAILCYAPALRLKLGLGSALLLHLLAPFITSIPKAPSTDGNPWQGYGDQPLKGAVQFLSLQKVIYPLLPQIPSPSLSFKAGWTRPSIPNRHRLYSIRSAQPSRSCIGSSIPRTASSWIRSVTKPLS